MAGLDSTKRRLALRTAVFAVAALAGIVAWLTTRGGGEPAGTGETIETRIVSAAELPNIAALTGHAVYWAGPVPDAELKATEGSDGSVRVSYVEKGAGVGAESPEALTIGSYPVPNPSRALGAFARQPGSVVHRGRDGREVVVSRQKPTSAYFASPDNSVQVEVYDPSPRRALSLALSSKVRPAG